MELGVQASLLNEPLDFSKMLVPAKFQRILAVQPIQHTRYAQLGS